MKNPAKVGVNSKKKQEKVDSISTHVSYLFFFILLADAEKLDYESDNGGRSKRKGGGGGASSKKHSPVRSKKRPAHSPPPTNGKKKKR
jgi:hypothetical protein